MTLYNLTKFQVPASAGTKETCQRDGHSMPDVRGKCIRCGAKVRFAQFNSAEGDE